MCVCVCVSESTKGKRKREVSTVSLVTDIVTSVQQLPVSVYCCGALCSVERRGLNCTQGHRLGVGTDEILHSC